MPGTQARVHERVHGKPVLLICTYADIIGYRLDTFGGTTTVTTPCYELRYRSASRGVNANVSPTSTPNDDDDVGQYMHRCCLLCDAPEFDLTDGSPLICR